MEIDAGIDPTVISNHQAELDAQISHFGILTLNIHIVRPNETFSQICEEITGKGNYKAWKSEAIKMGLKNPKLIHPGDVLVFSKS